MSDKKERNELGEPDNIVDMGDLHGNPIPSAVDDAADVMSGTAPEIPEPDLKLSDKEEELLKKKLDQIRKSDPFIYR
jgi:hypothetical protein